MRRATLNQRLFAFAEAQHMHKCLHEGFIRALMLVLEVAHLLMMTVRLAI